MLIVVVWVCCLVGVLLLFRAYFLSRVILLTDTTVQSFWVTLLLAWDIQLCWRVILRWSHTAEHHFLRVSIIRPPSQKVPSLLCWVLSACSRLWIVRIFAHRVCIVLIWTWLRANRGRDSFSFALAVLALLEFLVKWYHFYIVLFYAVSCQLLLARFLLFRLYTLSWIIFYMICFWLFLFGSVFELVWFLLEFCCWA